MYDEPTSSYDSSEKVRADYPDRSSRLPLSVQEKSLAELHDVIAQLTDRLTAVLTPIVEKEDREIADSTVKSQSPLAEQLEANNWGISRASLKLRGIIERLEC